MNNAKGIEVWFKSRGYNIFVASEAMRLYNKERTETEKVRFTVKQNPNVRKFFTWFGDFECKHHEEFQKISCDKGKPNVQKQFNAIKNKSNA